MLIYTGGGFIPGVPARNLNEQEVKELSKAFDRPDFRAVLVSSGLYAEEKIEHRAHANKALIPEEENKEA